MSEVTDRPIVYTPLEDRLNWCVCRSESDKIGLRDAMVLVGTGWDGLGTRGCWGC